MIPDPLREKTKVAGADKFRFGEVKNDLDKSEFMEKMICLYLKHVSY